jgi:hypothetical protein
VDVDTGDLLRDLTEVLTRRPPHEFEEARNRMTPTLIAYSTVHPEFGSLWRHSVLDPPRKCLKQILKRNMELGLLPADLDMELAMALLLGPKLYIHIFYKESRKKRDIGSETAEAFVRAFATRQPSRKGK